MHKGKLTNVNPPRITTEPTRATAGRYITRLAKEKKLCNISIPHNPIYEPMPGFYGKEKLPEPEQETDTATE